MLELTQQHIHAGALGPLLHLSHFYMRIIMRPYVAWEIPLR